MKKLPLMKIDKGIPIPKPYSKERRRISHHYPFRWMEIGDSFFTKNTLVHSAYSHFGVRNKGFKFTQRIEKDGIRVWRIK